MLEVTRFCSEWFFQTILTLRSHCLNHQHVTKNLIDNMEEVAGGSDSEDRIVVETEVPLDSH